jgi:RNA polymerase sigma factor (sigma-70 family)
MWSKCDIMSSRNSSTRLHDLLLEALPLAARTAEGRSTVALAVLRDPALDGDDLKQELLLGLLMALPNFDGRRVGLRTFIEHVAASRFASMIRRTKAKKRTLDQSVASDEALHVLVTVEFKIDLARMLRRLKLADRKVWQLLLENSPTQTARLLKTSRGSVIRSIRRIGAAFSEGGLGK